VKVNFGEISTEGVFYIAWVVAVTTAMTQVIPG